MNLPGFLIIGSMKSGTTTLYRDLYDHPNIFLPESKEPNDLAGDDVLAPAGLAKYATLFRQASAEQLIGEASTAYTKRPRFENSAERAREVLGGDVKLLFLVRHPLRRAVSQYQHEFHQEKVGADVDSQLLRDDHYVAYSRYYYQLQPWVDAFGLDRLGLISFEMYVNRRAETLSSVTEFLGVPSIQWKSQKDASFNATSGKPIVKSPLLKLVRDSHFYQRRLKPYFPWRWREKLRHRLLQPNQSIAPQPSQQTCDEFMRQISEDQNRFESVDWNWLTPREDVTRGDQASEISAGPV